MLALVSAVILESESRWTRDHIFTVSDSRLPFSSSTTRRATVEIFNPAFTRSIADNTVPNNTHIVVGVFTDLLIRNGLHNPVLLFLLACMLQALPSNDLCLHSLSPAEVYTIAVVCDVTPLSLEE
jgi:hypothetical protein